MAWPTCTESFANFSETLDFPGLGIGAGSRGSPQLWQNDWVNEYFHFLSRSQLASTFRSRSGGEDKDSEERERERERDERDGGGKKERWTL